MSRQTLREALHLARSGKSLDLARALHVLDGCPFGSWGETQQARRQLLELLPLRSLRSYGVSEFVGAAYTVEHGRYRRGAG